ncbi:unnamed protein product, partial [Closterium sp. Naga37s-1]
MAPDTSNRHSCCPSPFPLRHARPVNPRLSDPLPPYPSTSLPAHLLCVMSMRALAALTAASRGEDRMGVAQMAGANAAALSALLSALLALDSLLLSPSHRHPAAPRHLLWLWGSFLASDSSRYGGAAAGGSDVPGEGAGGGAVGRAVYSEGVVGPVWGEAWAMADV